MTSDPRAEPSAERYDRLALPFVRAYTDLVLQDLDLPRAGGRILDHGAGTGEVTLEVHRRHPTAQITAVDPDRGMLDLLRAKAGADTSWLTLLHGTIDTTAVPISAEVTVSQLVLSLTADPSHELRALRRHTRPGGSLRVAVLGGPDRMRAFAGYWQAASTVIPGGAAAHAYPHLRYADPGRLRTDAGAAGWQSPRVEPADTTRTVSGDQLWEWLSGTLPLYTGDGAVVDFTILDPVLVTDLREATTQQLAPYRVGAEEYTVPTGGWLLSATA
jgi:SAM-dependent methyltransferase